MAKLTDACAACGHQFGQHFRSFDGLTEGCTGKLPREVGQYDKEFIDPCPCTAPTMRVNVESMGDPNRAGMHWDR